MTHIIFLPDDHTLFQFDAPEAAAELVEAVNAGCWQPPEPYRGVFVLDGCQISGRGESPFRASQQGNLVVVMLSRAGDLALEPVTGSSPPALNRRELEVLHGLADGLTTRQIALRLGLTPRMVQYHVSALKRCLGARSRAQSVSRAQALGMVRKKR